MKVIVGLGNPGQKYTRTRHNLGFRVIERLKKEADPITRKRFKSEISRQEIAGQEVMLIKPLTYMNNSGRVVRQVIDATGEPLENLLVICDDFQLPFGKLRIRRGGSSGGHKGLESIIQHLQTDEFPRLRIGINSPANQDPVEFVLARFSGSEEKQLKTVIEHIVEAVKVWISSGLEAAMNRFN